MPRLTFWTLRWNATAPAALMSVPTEKPFTLWLADTSLMVVTGPAGSAR
jgi:hypothetical protein